MERNRECEKWILRTLQRGNCRIEAFDGREWNQQTVNAAIRWLLHSERIHNNGFHYHLGPPPVQVRRQKIIQPDFSMIKGNGQASTHKRRAERYTGELTDKSSAERRR